MAEEEDESPPDEGGGGSIPKWVVTFSDLMSLLLAFFVLLFAFSSQDDKKFKQMGGSLQEAFGVQRMDMFSDAVLGMNHIAQEFSSSRPDNTIVNIIPQEQFMMAIRYLTKEPPVRRNTLDSRGESEDDADKKKSEETVDPEAVEAAKA
ncbi:MAG: hypothetical protein KDD62_14275, partial [Bdellovibrionales bacterium]|nr:hypothetical protein [Bdellovibrionales bacterium]